MEGNDGKVQRKVGTAIQHTSSTVTHDRSRQLTMGNNMPAKVTSEEVVTEEVFRLLLMMSFGAHKRSIKSGSQSA